MRLPIERTSLKVYPDMKRVIIRYFFMGEERSQDVIGRIMALREDVVLGPFRQFFRSILTGTETSLRW